MFCIHLRSLKTSTHLEAEDCPSYAIHVYISKVQVKFIRLFAAFVSKVQIKIHKVICCFCVRLYIIR